MTKNMHTPERYDQELHTLAAGPKNNARKHRHEAVRKVPWSLVGQLLHSFHKAVTFPSQQKCGARLRHKICSQHCLYLHYFHAL
jgi:hypothetical protein